MTVKNEPSTDAVQDAGDEGGQGRSSSALLITIAIIALFVVVAVVALALVLQSDGEELTVPADDSAEAGFARDMIVHHSQAVEMALLLYDRSQNERLHIIAIDIALTQQGQIGQMQGWLAVWDLPQASADLPMGWMDMPTEGLMPGMATDAQLADLRASTGVDADRQFIALMIPHHEAGIHMAQGILERTDDPVVRRLAESIITSQQREIDELQSIAAELGTDGASSLPDVEATAEITPESTAQP